MKQDTKALYIEPDNFKGTLGKIELSPYKFGLIGVDFTHALLTEAIAQIFGSGEKAEADAVLLSNAKELVKALQHCIIGLEGMMPSNVAIDNPIHMAAYHSLHEAKQILKQALNQ